MNIAKLGRLAGLGLVAISMTGCATIVSGTTQKVSVTSQPSGAKVTADGKTTSTTPTDFTLERKNDHTLEFSKDGYKSSTVMLKKTINGMLAGNILIGGLIGTGVDAVSGANNKLIPERVDVTLEEGQGYSEVPKFASQADADFYEKAILKTAKSQKTNEKKAETVTQKIPAQTNFSPANTTAIASPMFKNK
jgi:hypothetical protein